MKLTDRLKVEHGVFLRQIRYVEALAMGGATSQELRVAVETLASAEEHHGRLEDRVLYPALKKRLGRHSEELEQVAADHATLSGLLEQMRTEGFTEAPCLAWARTMRDHMEREIHGLFELAEEVLAVEQLERMGNWNEEHVYEALGRSAPWEEDPSSGPGESR